MTIEQGLCCAQAGRCFYCREEFDGKQRKKRRGKAWTRDHLLPAAAGHGKTRNTVLACANCNRDKGARPATAEQLAAAALLHIEALRLMRVFNGSLPPEWTGERAPIPTRRALDAEFRKS